MNLITVLVVLLLIWLLYKLTTTYDKLVKEMREIRVKCVSPVPVMQ
jgi:flagellar biogenesis protein FliO